MLVSGLIREDMKLMGHIYIVKNVSIVVNLLTYAASEKDTSGPAVNYF